MNYFSNEDYKLDFEPPKNEKERRLNIHLEDKFDVDEYIEKSRYRPKPVTLTDKEKLVVNVLSGVIIIIILLILFQMFMIIKSLF